MGSVPTAPAFASVSEAMDMARAALGYLAAAAADAAQLTSAEQAECLLGLEQTDAISTAAPLLTLVLWISQARGL